MGGVWEKQSIPLLLWVEERQFQKQSYDENVLHIYM